MTHSTTQQQALYDVLICWQRRAVDYQEFDIAAKLGLAKSILGQHSGVFQLGSPEHQVFQGARAEYYSLLADELLALAKQHSPFPTFQVGMRTWRLVENCTLFMELLEEATGDQIQVWDERIRLRASGDGWQELSLETTAGLMALAPFAGFLEAQL